MKKTGNRILWLFATIGGLLIFGALIFLFDFLHATRAMTPSETGALND